MSMLRLDDTSEKNILNMLMDHKMINSEQMKRITNTSKEIGKTKLETAIELELANEDEIVKILSNTYSLPRVELKNYKLDNKLKKKWKIKHQFFKIEIFNENRQILVLKFVDFH